MFRAWAEEITGRCGLSIRPGHPSVAAVSGEYFADCNVAKARADASDAALAKKLWDVSEKIVAGLK